MTLYIGMVFIGGYSDPYPFQDFFSYLLIFMSACYTPITLVSLITGWSLFVGKKNRLALTVSLLPLVWVILAILTMPLSLILGSIYVAIFGK
jgi:hypothetical protein